MSHEKKYENESQDARRRDKHNEVHPDDKIGKHHDKSQNQKKPEDALRNPKK